MREDRIDRVPERAVVVGAGVVGLSTAWFLQEHGVDVTVVDREGVAAGASWGNAGYLAPSFSVPLAEPGVLRYGLRSLLDRDAPLYVPASFDLGLWSFLLGFARRCTTKAWREAMGAFVPVNADCLDAFDAMIAGGVRARTHSAPVTAGFAKTEQVAELRREFEMVQEAGQPVEFTELSATEVDVPQLSPRVESVIRLAGQRYVDPGEFVHALGRSVRDRGGEVRSGFDVSEVNPASGGVVITAAHGESIAADVGVVATGAWFDRLAKPLGVRQRVRAGRGYSFTVPTAEPVPGPIYLPSERVACTPYRGGLRVAGTMEFRSADAPLDSERIEAIVRAARPLLSGVSWEDRYDEWVGPRPVSSDSLPLIGASAMPGMFVAGGHGMWGLTLGPLTGRLVSERIISGKQSVALQPFDPLR